LESNGKLNVMKEQDPSLYTQSKGGQADSTEDDTSESGSETDLRLANQACSQLISQLTLVPEKF
jgi:hypothetical protein